jgi:hypothetical protein
MADRKKLPDRTMYGRQYEHEPGAGALTPMAKSSDYSILYRGTEDDTGEPTPYAHTYDAQEDGGPTSYNRWKLKEHYGYADGGLVDQPDPADQRNLTPLGLYSHAADVVNRMPQMKGTPQQFKAMMRKQGVKPDELKWSGYDAAMAGKPMVTKQELKQHFEQNLPKIQETTLAQRRGTPGLDYDVDDGTDPKFASYTLPGGKDYRELLLHTPQNYADAKHKRLHEIREQTARHGTTPALNAEYEALAAALAKNTGPPVNYTSSHWDTPNVLAHLRMSDRRDGKKKILHLEELQSDWGQEGREKGFAQGETARLKGVVAPQDHGTYRVDWEDGSYSGGLSRQAAEARAAAGKSNEKAGVPIAPYVDSTQKWVDLGLKRALHEAAKGGYDKLVVTPGEEQAKRYDLAKHIRELRYHPTTQYLIAHPHDRGHAPIETAMSPEQLPGYLGKDVAEKLLAQPLRHEDADDKHPHHALEGLDMQVGGHGMKTFYDKLVPQALEKLARKHDPEARVALHGHHLPSDKYKGYARYEVGSGPIAAHAVHGVRANGERVLVQQNHATRESAVKSADELNRNAKQGVPVHSLDITPRMRESILKGQPAYARGGAAYADPKSEHIADWRWRPLEDVHKELGLTEIPSHVEKFGSFMDDTAHRAEHHGLSPRDLIKAYTITRSSIQRGAVDADKVRKAGLILPPGITGKIRPEGAFGTWLHTKEGQRYLDEAEAGRPDEPSIAHAVQVMAPFGKHEKDIPDALRWAALNLPGREARISELVARARRMRSSPEEWRDATKDVRGIGSSKAGFYASLLGRGDQPTLDARQLILHTGKPSKEASPFIARKAGAGGSDATDRLAARQAAMNLSTPKDLQPYYQHLAHHAVWDKAGNDTTTHDDVVSALRGAATGGRITDPNLDSHPVVQAMRAAGLPGLGDDDAVHAHMQRLHSPFHTDNPESVAEALRIALGLKVNMNVVNKQAGFYNVNQPKAPKDVTSKVGALKGVTPVDKRQMSWEDLHREGKGGSFINLGGDRSNFGRLTHINGQKLAWPVDLHAGPGYMRELNPGAVWANNPGHSTSLKNKATEALKGNKKDRPVYGIYAPMGPRAIDSSHNMFDALMAQVPTSHIDPKDAEAFDTLLRSGRYLGAAPPKDVERAQKLMAHWPGILNARRARNFASDLPGTHRSAIVNAMDSSDLLKKGFPAVGMTRVAISDPEVRDKPGNMVGHRVVELDPSKTVEETRMKHSTYPSPIAGKYVGDLPLVQRQYAMPEPSRALLAKPTKAGQLVHPFSPDNLGRSTARKMFEEQKQVQPLDDRQLESTMLGLQRQKDYGFAKGGLVDQALRLAHPKRS